MISRADDILYMVSLDKVCVRHEDRRRMRSKLYRILMMEKLMLCLDIVEMGSRCSRCQTGRQTSWQGVVVQSVPAVPSCLEDCSHMFNIIRKPRIREGLSRRYISQVGSLLMTLP